MVADRLSNVPYGAAMQTSIRHRHGCSLRSARSTLQCVIWDIECENIVVSFGTVTSVTIHETNPIAWRAVPGPTLTRTEPTDEAPRQRDPDVRFGSKADIQAPSSDVRFWG